MKPGPQKKARRLRTCFRGVVVNNRRPQSTGVTRQALLKVLVKAALAHALNRSRTLGSQRLKTEVGKFLWENRWLCGDHPCLKDKEYQAGLKPLEIIKLNCVKNKRRKNQGRKNTKPR